MRLVLANYAMAVNGESDSDIIDFYRTGDPDGEVAGEANRVHNALVQEIARQSPAVGLVDTHAGWTA